MHPGLRRLWALLAVSRALHMAGVSSDNPVRDMVVKQIVRESGRGDPRHFEGGDDLAVLIGLTFGSHDPYLDPGDRGYGLRRAVSWNAFVRPPDGWQTVGSPDGRSGRGPNERATGGEQHA